MRNILIIILVFLVSGCVSVPLYPKGKEGTKVEFFSGNRICSECKKRCGLFKMSKDRKTVICSSCFDKKYL